MDQILEFIRGLTEIKILDILTAIWIIILFRISSSTIAYIIVKMFKLEVNKRKCILQSFKSIL